MVFQQKFLSNGRNKRKGEKRGGEKGEREGKKNKGERRWGEKKLTSALFSHYTWKLIWKDPWSECKSSNYKTSQRKHKRKTR